MEILVTYDVSTEDLPGQRRLRRVAQICINFGQRVQKSVFECSVNEMQLEQMRQQLLDCINQEADSLRIYRLPQPRESSIESYGRDEYKDFTGPLIV